ncbi:rho GTPase-activating protein 44-like isoform X2 [Hemicordylus capensis]|uniref:rho GTPase-activating protein 44-like isoform X2 n=1 Tax=Hemicordylus capensis TaxID=884348 RepID=UPI002304747B|nr:rho GTPase-activating protein 44-like isoform X2 [Hemicordylus capensis]
MSSLEKEELCQAIVHYLKSIGVQIPHWKTNSSQEKVASASSHGLFGVPLQLLPLSEHIKGVPQFLVNACELLRSHLHVEGLFRKCGSVTRIKALKARLEAGENCLEMALPCDVAILIKQFLRDVPEPLIPAPLQSPLCQVQQREDAKLRGPLTILLTCLLPQGSTDTLRYFFRFLQDVAARCLQNKMDLANLAVVFAPNLFSGGLCGKLDGRAEEELQRQVAVVQALISRASEIGTVPQTLQEKVQSAFSDMESKRKTPSGPEDAADRDAGRRRKRLRRRSVGDIVIETLSKFKSGRALCVVPGQEIQEDSLCNTAPRTSFSSKRKASDDAFWAAELSSKKRRSGLDSASSDPSEDAGDPFDQCSAAGTGQASRSPDLVLSSSTLNVVSDAGSPRIPPVKLQRKRSSCRKRPQRKHSVRTHHPSSSPAPFERKGTGHKSLRIFSRHSKDLASPSEAVEPSGWLLVKRMVTEALEGPTSQQRGGPLPSSKPKGSGKGSPQLPCDEDLRAPLWADPEVSVAAVKCQHTAGPCPCLGGLAPGHPGVDVDGLCGSCWGLLGKAEGAVGEAGPLASPPRHRRVLRRSLSCPEDLSAGDAAAEGRGFSPDETLLSPGGDEAQELGRVEPTPPGVEVLVAGMRQLSIPAAVCVTLADHSVASGPENGPCRGPRSPSQLDLPEAHPTPAGRLHHLGEAPPTRLKRLALAFQPPRLSASSQTSQGQGGAGLSPPKRKRGRRFERSLSHESGLPLQAGAETLAGHAKKRGATGLAPKSPLETFKAYGRQLFVTRKHFVLSLAAGLRGKKEPRPPNPQDTEPSAVPPQDPPPERLPAGGPRQKHRSPEAALAEMQLTASHDSLDF